MDEPAEYQAAVAAMEENFRLGIRAFAAWFAREWQQDRAGWVKAYDEPPPTDEWFKGYNAGIQSIIVAADAFLDDYHP